MDTGSVLITDASGNADQIFSVFDRRRDRLVDLMNRDFPELSKKLWQSTKSPVVIDTDCQCQMGAYHKLSLEQRLGLEDAPESIYLGEYYKCINCSALGILMEMEASTDDFVIEYGRRIGQRFKLVKVARGLRFLRRYDYPKDILASLLADDNYSKCEPGASKLRAAEFYGADGFTNKILVHMYAESILMKHGLQDMIPYMATAFICCQDSYTLMLDARTTKLPELKYSHLLSVDSLGCEIFNFKTVYGILAQLIGFFRVLGEYQFSCPIPSWDQVNFEAGHIKFTIDDRQFDANLKLIIDISSDCGITTVTRTGEVNRVFQYTEADARRLRSTPFRPKVESTTFDFTNCVAKDAKDRCTINKSYVYRLPIGDHVLSKLRQLGAFMYPSSLGLYSFLVLLMTDERFYRSVKSDERLNALWCSFFLAYDRKTLESRLTEAKITNVQKLLQGLYLRCDAVKHGWDLIKLINERP